MFRLLRPALFALDAEDAHRLTIAALKWRARLPAFGARADDPILRTEIAGLTLPNPIGLAAGFDKDAEVTGPMLGLGFGFVEAGTMTPRPQPGNPRPRLFRLVEDRAVINRFGFNNRGLAAGLARLHKPSAGIVGINVGANKDSVDRIADYRESVAAVTASGCGDYVTVNISSPNTQGLRDLQNREALAELLVSVDAARNGARRLPLFLKVAPDLDAAEIDTIAALAAEHHVDALIVSNTTVARPASLRSRHAGETGGLSGAPLTARAEEILRAFRAATGVPLIGVGGIGSAEDAYRRILSGASAVQLYTALAFEGPGLVRRIKTGLAALLRREGFASVSEAVGAPPRR
ncbi:quinone-dependent dihydroorotate dehydrogenase [soil metagenome]